MSMRNLALTAALLAAMATETLACGLLPGDPTIVERKNRVPLTIYGKVVKVDTLTFCEMPTRRLYFRIEKAFGLTAKAGDTVIVGSTATIPGCGVNYPVGQEVVVFGKEPPCPDNRIKMWSLIGNDNIEDPMFAQIDSLGGTSRVRARAAAGPATPAPRRREGARITFPSPQDGAGRRDAEGRALAP